MSKNYHTENKTFMVYKEWEEYMGMLSYAEAGMLFRALFAFASRGEEADFDGIPKMLFIMMRNTIDRDGKKWERVCDARELAKITRESKNSKSADKEKVKDKEKDIDIDKEKEKDIDKEPLAERQERPAGGKVPASRNKKIKDVSGEHSYDLDKLVEYALLHTPTIKK